MHKEVLLHFMVNTAKTKFILPFNLQYIFVVILLLQTKHKGQLTCFTLRFNPLSHWYQIRGSTVSQCRFVDLDFIFVPHFEQSTPFEKIIIKTNTVTVLNEYHWISLTSLPGATVQKFIVSFQQTLL